MTAPFKLSAFALLAGCVFFLTSSHANAKGYSPAVAGTTVSWTNAAIGKAQLSSAGTAVAVTAPVTISIAAGLSVPAVASAMITGASVGGAWGAAIYGLGAVAVAAIPAIKARMDAAGVRAKPDGTFETLQSGSAYSTDYASGSYSSFEGACEAAAAATGYVYGRRGPNPNYCYVYRADNSDYTANVYYMRVAVAQPSYQPATVADSQAKMSAASPTIAEVQALVDANFPPAVAPQAITGPVSVDGANTVKLGLDGSSQTETCKFYIDYFPSNIKAHPECTTVTTIPERTESKTVTTTNPDGTKSTQVISTTTPASSSTSVASSDKVKQEDQSPVDSPLGDVPVLYTPKYATGLEGVWSSQRALLVATPLANLATSLMPSVSSSGACPTMNVNLTFSSWANFGTHNVAPPCSIWDFGRIVILISALLLARRLIFGG